MTGGMQHFNAQLSEPELFTVPGDIDIKSRFGLWSVNDGGACRFCKVKMTAYEVSVKMCLKNIFNGCFSFRSQFQVRIDIAQGIHYGCFAITFDIICRFADAACVELLYVHKKFL